MGVADSSPLIFRFQPEVDSPAFATARAILARIREAGQEAYLVGGSVRDLLRGVIPEDYDIATSARPEEIRSLFPQTISVGASFGVMLVVAAGHTYEVATFRTDQAYRDGRRPSGVVFAGPEEDVRRRDFTVNALLFDPFKGEIIDYVGGYGDLTDKTIRAIGSARERFAEDHLRMLRAIRFACALNFHLEPATQAAIASQAASIRGISAERIRQEMTKILTSGQPRRGLLLLEATALLPFILPEVAALKGIEQPAEYHPEGDVWNHTLNILDALAGSLPQAAPFSLETTLAWAALLHDIGKGQTAEKTAKGIRFPGHAEKGAKMAGHILTRLRFPATVINGVVEMIRQHMHFIEVQNMRPARLKRFLRQEMFPLLLELLRLDIMASHGRLANYEFCLRQRETLREEDLAPKKLLNGHDLKTLGYPPGPLFAEILAALEDAQLENRITNPDEARSFVLENWAKP